MTSLFVLQYYFVWHYSVALKALWHLWRNFLWFTIHFFSIPLLLRSLFAPWKRMTEPAGKGWDFEAIAGSIVIGFFSRLVGATLRLILIVLGSIVLLLECIGLIVLYCFWLLAPFLIAIFLVWGITSII